VWMILNVRNSKIWVFEVCFHYLSSFGHGVARACYYSCAAQDTHFELTGKSGDDPDALGRNPDIVICEPVCLKCVCDLRERYGKRERETEEKGKSNQYKSHSCDVARQVSCKQRKIEKKNIINIIKQSQIVLFHYCSFPLPPYITI